MPRLSSARRLRGLPAVAALAVAVATPQVVLAAASFEILPFTPALFFPPGDRFLSMSADGRTVVGQFRATEHQGPTHAARWRADTGVVTLDPPPTTTPATYPGGAAYGISADGTTAVGEATGTGPSSFFHAVVWDNATNAGTLIPGLLGRSSLAVDVSADGSIVLGDDFDGVDGIGSFVWDATNGSRSIAAMTGESIKLVGQAISDDGTVVAGVIDGTDPWQAFRWSETDGAEPLGFLQEDGWSFANQISGDGTTIVGSAKAPGISPRLDHHRGLSMDRRWRHRGLGQVMHTPYYADPGVSVLSWKTEAFAVSADGSVIVGGGEAAWLHSEEYGGMISIRDLLIQLGVAGLDGWNLVEAVDVSADGRVITGWAYNPSLGVEDYAWRAVIPEPSTALLLGLGLAAISGRGSKGRIRVR